MPPLPETGGLELLSVDVWAQVRERLQAIEFAAQYTQNIRLAPIGAYADNLQRPLLLWHLRRLREPAAHALRMCVLRDAITFGEAGEVFGGQLLDALLAAGMLIRPEPNMVLSEFDLRVFRGLLILCDDLTHRGDAVYGAGYGTRAFRDLWSRRGAIHRALDVGCGAGAVALWQCSYARHVVATDINPRALTFVKINAALNGVSNIEVREGSLFEAVDDEKFDFITSQLPYVPRAPGLRHATYLFGGPRGNELVTRLLLEMPHRLRPQGRSMVVFEHPVGTDADDFESGVVSPGLDSDTRTLFIVGREVDAAAYSLRHAAPELRRGIEAFDTAVTEMREHLHAVEIRGLCPAIAVLERAQGLRGWTTTLRAGNDLWNDISTEMIERLLAAQVLLHEPTKGLRHARVRIPNGSLLVRPLTKASEAANTIYLGLPPGHLISSLELSQHEWTVLEAGEREDSLEQLPKDLIAKAAHAGLIEERSTNE
jgi:SAM-dependent methyltransferase